MIIHQPLRIVSYGCHVSSTALLASLCGRQICCLHPSVQCDLTAAVQAAAPQVEFHASSKIYNIKMTANDSEIKYLQQFSMDEKLTPSVRTNCTSNLLCCPLAHLSYTLEIQETFDPRGGHCRVVTRTFSDGRTDGRTDRQTDGRTMVAGASVTWKHCSVLFEITWDKTLASARTWCVRADASASARTHLPPLPLSLPPLPLSLPPSPPLPSPPLPLSLPPLLSPRPRGR
jgi:hypothetical protein